MDLSNSTYIYLQEPLQGLLIFATVILVLDGLLILFLNPLCLLVLHRLSSLQDSSKVFLTSLTAADLGIGLTWVIPRASEVLVGHWPFGEFLCVVYGVITTVLITASVLSLLLLTLDRYIAIVHALRYTIWLTKTRARLAVCFTWFLSTAVNTICFGVLTSNQCIIATQPPHMCIWPPEAGLRQYTIIIFYITVLGLMVCLYSHILVVARRQAKRIQQEAVSVGQASPHQPLHRAKLRAARTVFIIFAALVVSWIPSLFQSIAQKYHPDVEAYRSEGMRAFVHCCFMANSWLNVIIYFINNRDFRQTLQNLRHC